jgi:hypothetical protein
LQPDRKRALAAPESAGSERSPLTGALYRLRLDEVLVEERSSRPAYFLSVKPTIWIVQGYERWMRARVIPHHLAGVARSVFIGLGDPFLASELRGCGARRLIPCPPAQLHAFSLKNLRLQPWLPGAAFSAPTPALT